MLAKRTRAEEALIAGGVGVLLGALLHVGVLTGGPDWIAFVGAPASIIQSARDGTWLARAGALGVAALLTVWALYAFSGAGVIRRLPLLRTVLAAIAVIFLLRGLVIVPFLGRVNWRHPIDLSIVSSSFFILGLGAAYALGAVALLKRQAGAKG